MFRRLFVSVLVAALALVITPRPSFGLDAGDHKRCMYRCKERGLQKPQPTARLDAPIKPLRHNCRWCGDMHGGWGPGWGGRWSFFSGWIWNPRGGGYHPWGGGWGSHPDWYDNGDDDRWFHRPGRWNRWHRGHRGDRWDRYRDRSRSSGYNHHREHPRGRDF
jgi:hypothetical protein